ncbi:class A sortase [uncultured Helcococcus sp.]|uniref:class A sortase n=1 Tax=uncultured Helcococcus sp. TaxID=1072508 RepID=UPI00288ADC41|nr:class A sortase [uncultured Helcococcus sp.]
MRKKLLTIWAIVIAILLLLALYLYRDDFMRFIKYNRKTGVNGYVDDYDNLSNLGLNPSYNVDDVENLSRDLVDKYKDEANRAVSKGRILIPSVNIDEKIFEGINNAHLLLGVCEQLPRSQVKAGDHGNYILAGHISFINEHFILTPLNKVKLKDKIFVLDQKYAYVYEIDSAGLYHVSDTRPINIDTDEKMITIYTCKRHAGYHPTERFVVQGRLADKFSIENFTEKDLRDKINSLI